MEQRIYNVTESWGKLKYETRVSMILWTIIYGKKYIDYKIFSRGNLVMNNILDIIKYGWFGNDI